MASQGDALRLNDGILRSPQHFIRKNSGFLRNKNMYDNWVNIHEYLPLRSIEDSYLITDGEEIGVGYLDYDTMDRDDDSVYWIEDSCALSTDVGGWPKVTHWMALPALPNQ